MTASMIMAVNRCNKCNDIRGYVDTKVQTFENLMGRNVHILNNHKTIIADGIVTDQFIDDIAIVFVTCVRDMEQRLTFIFRTNTSVFINDWKNNHIVWRTSMLQYIAEPTPEQPSITVNPPPPSKRRLRLPQKRAPSNDSVVSSEYDIELERVKSKTRRLAKQLK